MGNLFIYPLLFLYCLFFCLAFGQAKNSSGASTSSFLPQCPPASYEELQKTFRGQGQIELVFFASWCSGCETSLKQESKSRRILIAAFDERLRAEKVLLTFGIQERCFSSDGIVEALGVGSLPATRVVSF